VFGLDDCRLDVQRGVGIGVVLTFEGDADHVVFVVDERARRVGRDEVRILDRGHTAGRVHREAVGEQRQDGRESDQPPGAAPARDDRRQQGERGDDRKGDERPLELAGEQDEVQAVGVLGPNRVRPVPHDACEDRRHRAVTYRRSHAGLGPRITLAAGAIATGIVARLVRVPPPTAGAVAQDGHNGPLRGDSG